MNSMRLGSLLFVSAFAGCTIIDSVNGFAGPPLDDEDGGSRIDGSKPCATDTECEDKNPCTADSCWGERCVHAISNGKSCSDGDVCNGDEVCDENGICVLGIPPQVEDDDLCTVDTCDSKLGVQHTNTATAPLNLCQADCPSGYFVSALFCTDECPEIIFGIHGAICEQICKPEIIVCCNDCTGTTCPAGYQPSGYQPTTCICGQPSSGLICRR